MGIAIVFMFLGASICASVASGKHRSVAGWAFAGAMLPLIGVIIICSLPPEQLAVGGAAPPPPMGA